jgi:two-component system chemotaxis response regulator CheB
MPRNAAEAVAVDYVLPIAKMGNVLNRLAREPANEMLPIPEDILLEMKILEEEGESDVSSAEKWGDLTPLVCPDCGGSLWKLEVNGLERYRCHLGHAFSPRNLLAEQDTNVERALWSAQRVLEERAKVLTNIAKQERKHGQDLSAKRYEERAAESKAHAKAIQTLLLEKF